MRMCRCTSRWADDCSDRVPQGINAITACRPGEACAVRWSDVHFEKRAVILDEHQTAAKTGKPRIIPLVPSMIQMPVWMRQLRQVRPVEVLERLLRNGPVKGVEVARFMSHTAGVA